MKPTKKPKLLPWDQCLKNHVALKIAYLGYKFDVSFTQGLAIQDNTKNTVEEHLFAALKRAHLIEDRKTCNYSRCGRTDKGVSAFGNVVSVELRSRAGHPQGDYYYPAIINKMLPKQIRVTHIAYVPHYFDARFSCLYREYRYFFLPGSMHLDKMQEAANKFVGLHDFRNFCKVDPENNKSFERRVLSCEVRLEEGMGVVVIKGLSFLWHQVRCMMGCLFLVGKGFEEPELIDKMLDVELTPSKPHYDMASETGLVLYNCAFEGLEWTQSPENTQRVYWNFKEIYSRYLLKTTMVSCLLSSLSPHELEQPTSKKRKVYTAHKPILSRTKQL